MDYSGVPRPGKKDAPVREPPPKKKSPKKKPAKKAPRAGGEADEGC